MEQFKDVKGYEGLYKVSENGVIIRLDTNKEIGKRRGNGYTLTKLFKNGENKTMSVHRIVAEAFIPNPEGKPCVNHIDGDKTNNHVSNLEWVTYSENTSHAFQTGLCNNLKIPKGMEKFSFKKGFSQVRQKDVANVKHEIMSALGITTRMGWSNRIRGIVEPKISEAKAIEETFAKYGIKEVWGE